jgi:hypothetical protein
MVLLSSRFQNKLKSVKIRNSGLIFIFKNTKHIYDAKFICETLKFMNVILYFLRMHRFYHFIQGKKIIK